MITFFALALTIGVIIAYKVSNGKILYNDSFWLLVCWFVIIGVHFVSGVKWKYEVTVGSFVYVVFSLLGFFVFKFLGIHSKINNVRLRKPISRKKYRLLKILGWMGVFLFSFDYIRLNSIVGVGKSQYALSFIGAIGSLLIPILLVIGLYELGESYLRFRRIKFFPVISLIGYTLPCILNSGRESLFYIVIGFLAMISFCKEQIKKHSGKTIRISIRKMITIILLVIVAICVGNVILKTTLERFTNNEMNVFLYYHDVPQRVLDEADRYGSYKFLYYNFISYFGHQLPFIEYILHFYRGPRLLGFYELNIISRRLPAILGLDYRLIYNNIDSVFSGSWQTVLGSFMFDFGTVFAPVVCMIFGFIVGRIRKKLQAEPSIERGVLNSLICIAMFTTIQLGPFYNFLVYGCFFWWYIFFGNNRRVVE